MRVFLVRHGKAEAADEWRGPDRDRPLRPRGERQAKWLGERLAARPAGERPALILSSPYVRAIETARILHRALRCELREEPALEPGGEAHGIDALIRADAGPGPPAIALVGHNPLLEDALTFLVRGLRGEAGVMRTGEAAEIEYSGAGRSRLLGRLRLDDD